jgi:hypothetical protein
MKECSVSPRIKIPPPSPKKESKNEAASLSPRGKDLDLQKTRIKVMKNYTIDEKVFLFLISSSVAFVQHDSYNSN